MTGTWWTYIVNQLPEYAGGQTPDTLQTSTRVVTETIVALSYFAIEYCFIKLLIARNDTKTDKWFWLFVVFITGCGFFRIMTLWNLWYGYYTIRMLSKIGSAISAAGTALCLWPLIPRLKAIPSVQDVEIMNNTLRRNIMELATAFEDLAAEKKEKEVVQATLIQSQKMEAVGQLTGGIAHDFNNILMAISGNLELIKITSKEDKILKWTERALSGASKAAHLTAQLLSFSRIQKLQLKEMSLETSLHSLDEMIKRTIAPDISISVQCTCFDIVKIDPIQLELALLNLCLNARDAMLDGGNLSISTMKYNDYIDIDVTDSGSGIPKDLIDKIFDPFFTTKEVGKGTGLGLSMVYGVVRQSGGEVFVKDTSPLGTTITVRLPIIYTQDYSTQHAAEDCNFLFIRHKTILLVDDDPDVRMTLTEILTAMKYEVIACEDGVEALKYLKHHKPDLMIIDYIMPVMNGAAVMKAARTLYKDLPIVFVTGYSNSTALESYTVLKKPFTIKDIEKLLCLVFQSI